MSDADCLLENYHRKLINFHGAELKAFSWNFSFWSRNEYHKNCDNTIRNALLLPSLKMQIMLLIVSENEQKDKQSEWKFYDNLIAIQMIFCLSLFMQLQLADGSKVNNAWADFNVVQNHSTWKCFHELKLFRINFSYLSHCNCTHGFTKIQVIQFGILNFSLLL